MSKTLQSTLNLHYITLELFTRVAQDMIFFKSDRGWIWPDLDLQIRPGPNVFLSCGPT